MPNIYKTYINIMEKQESSGTHIMFYTWLKNIAKITTFLKALISKCG